MEMTQTSQESSERVSKHLSTTRLRVLAVNTLFPNVVQPYWGIFNALALKSMANIADVRVISPVKWFPGLSLISSAERRLARVPATGNYHGISVCYPKFFRTPGFGRSWHAWFYARSIEKTLIREVESLRPHVLLASWADPDGVAVQQLGDKLGIPVVIKCLGSDIHRLLHDPSRKQQVMGALARCNRVVTVSNSLRIAITSRGISAEKVKCVYNGVDRTLFHPIPRCEARVKLNLPPHGKIILCVASLLPVKGHKDLIQAFKFLLQKYGNDATLILVGEGPLRESLMKQVRALELGARVVFAGGCKHDRVPDWINAADIVCLASHNEGLPNVLVEALACGRPVVATNVGGIPELIRCHKYGRLVQPHDEMSLAQALNDVLGRNWDPNVLSACPDVISWEQSAAELRDVLFEAVGNN